MSVNAITDAARSSLRQDLVAMLDKTLNAVDIFKLTRIRDIQSNITISIDNC